MNINQRLIYSVLIENKKWGGRTGGDSRGLIPLRLLFKPLRSPAGTYTHRVGKPPFVGVTGL